MEENIHEQQEQNSHKSNALGRVTGNQLGFWYDGATGVELLEIDRGALYSGQRTAEETRAPRVISIRMQLQQRICKFNISDTVCG